MSSERETLHRLFGLTGEVAVVTGAGRGIGEGIAKVLAGAGASVVCAARRAHEVEGVAAQIEIMLNRDPNITGFVKYENLEKAKMAFKHLTKLGPILNFMYYNMTNNDTAFKWSHIVNIEVSAEKKKTKEEIEKDGINFSIKSDMEREAELQAAMMGAEMGEEPPGEVPPQLQKENDKLI